MVYSAFTSGEVDQDSPLDATFFSKMKANFDALKDGSALDNDIVDQGLLKTQTQAVDVASSNIGSGLTSTTLTLLTSPDYSIGYNYAGVGVDSTSFVNATLGGEKQQSGGDWGTQNGYISLIRRNSAGVTNSIGINADVIYIQSSPPYDIGDGEVPLFVFVKLDADGKITQLSAAQDPPWMYNGPTNTNYNKRVNGRKYRFEKYVDENGEIQKREIEITQAVKNADMDTVPHPFILKENESVVLLDPVETLELMELMGAGERVSSFLFNDYLRIDNTPINRACPQGVLPCGFKWRDTKRKSGAAVADRRQAAVEK